MNETSVYFIKILGMFLFILLLIFILAVLTPKLAKILDRLIDRFFRNRPKNNDDSIYKVRSIYDISKDMSNAEKASKEKIINDGESENGEE